MGGHGGLNILPQKEWNVYRVDRQYQVKYDYHRKVESELAEKERKRKKKYNDTLVKLKRERLGSKSPETGKETSADDQRELIKTAVKRHIKASFGERYQQRERSDESSADEELKKLRGDDLYDRKHRKGHFASSMGKTRHSNDQISERAQLDDEARGIKPFRLFEREEMRDKKRQEAKREELIKASCYVYNGSASNAKQLNIYTDTTAEGKQNLVSDFKQFAQAPKPWYSKRCDWYHKPLNNSYNEEIANGTSGDALSKSDVLRSKSNGDLLKERLDREARERERAQQLMMKKNLL